MTTGPIHPANLTSHEIQQIKDAQARGEDIRPLLRKLGVDHPALNQPIRGRDYEMLGDPYTELEVVPVLQAQRDSNCARGLPSVQKEGIRDARVAIVGYGPSLQTTWPRLLAGRYDAVWTTSKAHDFLIEKGIRVTHHTDSDFRAHKAQYNNQFQPYIRYLMATQIHPSYLDRLAQQNVQLFHIVQPNGGLYNMKYFKQPVSFDVSLQAAQLAYNLGYRVQEWYGCDASIDGLATHAGPHEGWKIISNDGKDQLLPFPVEVAGQVYQMNQFLVRQAIFAERMLRKHPKLKVKIHGNGALRPFLQERGRVVIY